jgi:hypothetical protein
VGGPLDRAHANGRHYFVKRLHRLRAAGALVQLRDDTRPGGGSRRWGLGPVTDMLKEQGKLT